MSQLKDIQATLFDLMQHWKESFRENGSQWAVSLGIHAVILLALGVWQIDVHRAAKRAQVISTLEDERPEEELFEKLEETVIDLETPVSLMQTNSTKIAGSESIQETLQAVSESATAARAVSDRSLFRPLATGSGNMSLGSTVTGLKGISSLVGGDGGGGAIDRITQEILRQLDKNKVVVAWIMDGSGSLDARREMIAHRLKRVYKELDELGANKNNALLTTVVGFGAKTTFLLNDPTNDPEAIAEAVQNIPEDETGVENVFGAIRATALKYRRMQTSGRRTLMIVVLTDEIGDDVAMVDDTTALVKRNKVPVYVLGPMATFSHPSIRINGTDPETKERWFADIRRGPETRVDEVLRVPFDRRAYISGFGPFGLSKVASETGGIYFLFDDQRVRGPEYDMELLLRFKPHYGTQREYVEEIATSNFRRTLMEVVKEGNRNWRSNLGGFRINAESVKPDLDRAQRALGPFLSFAQKAIPSMKAAQTERSSETSLRWRASFDLTMARLLQAKIRCDELNWALAQLKLDPPRLENPESNNGWSVRLSGRKLAASVEQTDDAKQKKIPKSLKDNVKLREESQALFAAIIEEYPDTPWAEAAQREAPGPVGVLVAERFFPPPPKTPGPKRRNL